MNKTMIFAATIIGATIATQSVASAGLARVEFLFSKSHAYSASQTDRGVNRSFGAETRSTRGFSHERRIEGTSQRGHFTAGMKANRRGSVSGTGTSR